mgnify:CR=1 FL=1
MVAARSGSRSAAEQLCRRHLPAVWRAAYAVCGSRAAADDAVQDCFERALRNLDRFDVGRPFGPWIHRIAVNCALDQVRRGPRHELLEERHEPATDGESAVHEREELIEALSTLSIEVRTVVVARVLLDVAPPDVARMLDIPVGTVHSRLSRGMDALREELEGALDG